MLDAPWARLRLDETGRGMGRRGTSLITVRKLAGRFGISRTTLLYYDRIGLLRPEQRSPAGYRLYGPGSVERLGLICSYKRAGLSLGDIRVLLEHPERESEKVLRERLVALDGQVLELRVQQRAIMSMLRSLGATDSRSNMDKETWVEILRESGMDEPSMERWHARFERNAPEAHRAFLAWLGIPEVEATRIRARARRSEPEPGASSRLDCAVG